MIYGGDIWGTHLPVTMYYQWFEGWCVRSLLFSVSSSSFQNVSFSTVSPPQVKLNSKFSQDSFEFNNGRECEVDFRSVADG